MKHSSHLPLFAFRFTLFVLLAMGVFSLHAQGLDANAQVGILRNVGIDQKLDQQVPLELVFRDEAGKPAQLREYFGEKPVILSLVYYNCPMLCTLVLNGQLRSFRALPFDIGDEFNVVTVSFDPSETPALAAEKKANYIKQYGRRGAAEGWHFLTGDSASIKQLTETVGFRYTFDTMTKQFVHASGIMLLTPHGKLARYFYGVEYSPKDLRLSLVEASTEKIGSPVDQVLLYCYHYDPATGKYGVVIMNIIRLAGVATVLVLGTLMLIMFRRDSRKLNVKAQRGQATTKQEKALET